jgi:HEAT repeat protein
MRINFLSFFLVLMFYAAPYLCFGELSLKEIRSEYKREDLEGRLVLMQALDGRTDCETVDFLMVVAGSGWENWQVKIKAIQFLGEAHDPKAVDMLLNIFTSDSAHYMCPAIKTAAAIALGNFRDDRRVLDALIWGIRYDEPQVREASVQSLGNIGDAAVVPHLICLLYDNSIAIRLSTIKALERIADPQAAYHLKILSEEDNDEVVRHIAESTLKNFHKK